MVAGRSELPSGLGDLTPGSMAGLGEPPFGAAFSEMLSVKSPTPGQTAAPAPAMKVVSAGFFKDLGNE